MAIDFQAGLFSDSGVGVPPLAGRVRRMPLGRGAWVDLAPGWIAGADEVFPRLAEGIPWHAERRAMYDRTVDVPRLLCMYGLGDELPDPVLTEPVFPARKHSEYTLDRQWDAVVAAAAGLTPTDPGPL